MLTLKEHVYLVILEKLRTGGLRAGARLSDDALAKEIGISRTPVREAISQLTSEGFVEYRPRRGSFVKVPDRRETAQLYEARLALEGFAAGKAAERATEDDLVRLEQLNVDLLAVVRQCRQSPSQVADEELVQRFLELDLNLHMEILRVAGNDKITAMVRECKILTAVFGHVPVEHDLRLMAKTYRQHSLVLRSIRCHDAARARQAMIDHIAAAGEVVLCGYDKLTSPASPTQPEERIRG